MERKLHKRIREKLINRSEINEEIKLINGSSTDYVSPIGNIYKDYGNGLFFKKKTHINKNNNYVYVGVTMKNGKNRSHRVHKLVATAFLEKPLECTVVGHKNNIKHDNRVENLYWTTVQENTQKAYDDGLAVNKKGYEDSQSKPVNVYKNGVLICDYGSLKECSREMNIPIQTIIRRCNNEIKTVYRKYKEYDFKYK